VWNLVEGGYVGQATLPKAEKELRHLVHKTIKKVTEDLERFRFNTMLACLMEFTNHLSRVQEAKNVSGQLWQEAIGYLLLLLAPSAPHLTEELWARTGRPYSVHNQSWPSFDEELAKEEEITLAIQINGKLRDKLLVPASIGAEEAKEQALERERVQVHTRDREIARVIYVPKRVVNIVVT
jgi:leucyl-tRNA synthetase